jgi:hypothetical protein
MIGTVTGPGAPGRDRALSLLALYAGARVGGRAVVHPAARAGRRAGRGVAWAGSTFLGRDRGSDGKPLAPVRAPGVPLGGVRRHVEVGERDRPRGWDDPAARRSREWPPERRPGDRPGGGGPTRSQERGRPTDKPRRPGSDRQGEAAESMKKESRPRRGGGRGGWRGRSGRKRGRAAGSTPRVVGGAVDRKPTGAAGDTPRRRPPGAPRPAAPRPPVQAPRAAGRSDLGEALKSDARRRQTARPAPRTADKAPVDDRRAGKRRGDEGSDEKGRSR